LRRRVDLLLAAALLLTPARASAEVIWVEGEDATVAGFNQHGWYSNADGELLSPGSPETGVQGGWLAHFANNSSQVQSEWSFTAEEGGELALWIRSAAYRTAMEIQLDEGDWVELDHARQREVINLVRPALDVRFLGWTYAGTFDLAPGEHTLRAWILPHDDWGGSQIYGGIDCFCLTDLPGWSPTGALQPDPDPAPAGPDEWFVYQVGDDPFSPDSVTDVSHLLEAPAGQRGFVQADDSQLVFADGTPVRFWGVDAGLPGSSELFEQQARLFAKHGINLVRRHTVQETVGLAVSDGAGGWSLPEEGIDTFDRWFAAMKAEGIHIDFSVFYPHVITEADGYDSDLYAELPDRGEGKSTSGVVGFVEELQDAEWRYLELLLDHVNPYTGLRYADDPALAVVEVHNEDSVFWHAPLNALSADADLPLHTARLKQGWADWLAGVYADDAELLAAWGPPGEGSREGDSLSNAAMPIYGAWELEADGPWNHKDETRRAGDFIRFLAETQRAYYERRRERIRQTGYGGLVVSTAWRSGGPAGQLANLWTDASVDAVDRHAYWGGGEGGFQIAEGPVEAASLLHSPGEGLLGMGLWQTEDLPSITTEWNSNPPNEWRAEAAPLVAFYGLGLQGWDASMHFTASKAWMRTGWPSLSSFVSETPLYMGQFPALATSVIEGHVAEAELAAARRFSLDAAFAGVDARSQPVGLGWADGGDTLEVPAEVLAIGRVTASFAETPEPSERVDWDAFVDPATGRLDSMTGELTWHPSPGYFTVATERTQALVGFAAGSHDLGDVQVELATDFASLLFTPLDGRPLAESGQILVTATARDRQAGTVYIQNGEFLEAVGGPPLLLEPVQATLTFAGEPVTSVRPLDVYGVPRDEEVERVGNSVTIDGRWRTTWYEVRTEAFEEPGDDDDSGGDDDDSAAGDDDDSAGGCGCVAAGHSQTGLLALALAGLLSLRRRPGDRPRRCVTDKQP